MHDVSLSTASASSSALFLKGFRVSSLYNLLSYRQIKNLLHNRAYIIEDEDRETRHTATPEHENLRGSGYYN